MGELLNQGYVHFKDFSFFKDFIDREEGREKVRERNINAREKH